MHRHPEFQQSSSVVVERLLSTLITGEIPQPAARGNWYRFSIYNHQPRVPPECSPGSPGWKPVPGVSGPESGGSAFGKPKPGRPHSESYCLSFQVAAQTVTANSPEYQQKRTTALSSLETRPADFWDLR
jgi:hypothetical protein